MTKINKIVGIYKIVSPTGKIYIGQSWDIHSRFKQHKRERRPIIVLNRSIIKYGHKSHTFSIVHMLPFDTTQKVLDTYEQLYIDAYKSLGFHMLNMKDAGSTGKMSSDAKKRMSIKNKGRQPWNTGLKGAYSPSADVRKRIGKAHTGRKNTPETIEKMKAAATGRKHTPETLEKLRNAKLGKPGNRLGYKCTEDQKKAMSEVSKKMWELRRSSLP